MPHTEEAAQPSPYMGGISFQLRHDNTIAGVSGDVALLFGRSSQELWRSSFLDLVAPNSVPAIRAALNPRNTHPKRLSKAVLKVAGDERRPFSLQINPRHSGGILADLILFPAEPGDEWHQAHPARGIEEKWDDGQAFMKEAAGWLGDTDEDNRRISVISTAGREPAFKSEQDAAEFRRLVHKHADVHGIDKTAQIESGTIGIIHENAEEIGQIFDAVKQEAASRGLLYDPNRLSATQVTGDGSRLSQDAIHGTLANVINNMHDARSGSFQSTGIGQANREAAATLNEQLPQIKRAIKEQRFRIKFRPIANHRTEKVMMHATRPWPMIDSVPRDPLELFGILQNPDLFREFELACIRAALTHQANYRKVNMATVNVVASISTDHFRDPTFRAAITEIARSFRADKSTLTIRPYPQENVPIVGTGLPFSKLAAKEPWSIILADFSSFVTAQAADLEELSALHGQTSPSAGTEDSLPTTLMEVRFEDAKQLLKQPGGKDLLADLVKVWRRNNMEILMSGVNGQQGFAQADQIGVDYVQGFMVGDWQIG